MKVGRPLREEVWSKVDFATFKQIMGRTTLEGRTLVMRGLLDHVYVLLIEYSRVAQQQTKTAPLQEP